MSDAAKVKTAKMLLKLGDSQGRKRVILKNILFLVICFAGHALSHRWDSPLSLIPETFLAILMGMQLLTIAAVRRFPLQGEYIDWDAVRKDAGLVSHDN